MSTFAYLRVITNVCRYKLSKEESALRKSLVVSFHRLALSLSLSLFIYVTLHLFSASRDCLIRSSRPRRWSSAGPPTTATPLSSRSPRSCLLDYLLLVHVSATGADTNLYMRPTTSAGNFGQVSPRLHQRLDEGHREPVHRHRRAATAARTPPRHHSNAGNFSSKMLIPARLVALSDRQVIKIQRCVRRWLKWKRQQREEAQRAESLRRGQTIPRPLSAELAPKSPKQYASLLYSSDRTYSYILYFAAVLIRDRYAIEEIFSSEALYLQHLRNCVNVRLACYSFPLRFLEKIFT